MSRSRYQIEQLLIEILEFRKEVANYLEDHQEVVDALLAKAHRQMEIRRLGGETEEE